jgi:hypothetical protein
MNQLMKRLNRRKVSRKAGKASETSEGLAPPQAQPMFLEVPDPVKIKVKRNPAVESATTNNRKPDKRSRIRKLLSNIVNNDENELELELDVLLEKKTLHDFHIHDTTALYPKD